MTGGMHRGLITASSDANAVEHEHQHQQCDVVPETIGDHGARVAVVGGMRGEMMPDWVRLRRAA